MPKTGSAPQPPAVKVQDLTCARGSAVLLEGVSFDVAPGEVLELRGPNGVGKTTLLRTLAGLQPPVCGHVVAADESMAYSAHADGIKATLSVRENLIFWAGVYRVARIDEAVSAFALEPLLERPAGQMSAGQKRRLGLARLLVTGRPIWLMDEPTVSLDGHARAQLVEVIKAHLAQGGSALVSTHVDLGLQARHLDLTPFIAAQGSTDASFDGDWA